MLIAAGLTLVPTACLPAGPAPVREPVTWAEITAIPPPPPGHRIPYGEGPFQFGELRLPDGPGPHPVAVVLHGGCWRAEFNLAHIAPLSAALTRAGVATWTLEYRRIGNPGGGWPGTFGDVAQGTEKLRGIAQQFPLDLDRVVVVGHSAGGHLALWLAGRGELPPDSPLHAPALAIRGVVTLAGITDLREYGEGRGSCNAAVAELLGGRPEQVPERYRQASPIDLIPLGVPQLLLHGTLDPIVPLRQSEQHATRARDRGDDAQLWPIDGAGHFDLIAPFAPAFQRVEEAVRTLLTR